MASRMASGRGSGSAGGGRRSRIALPALTRWAGSRIVRPSIAISPAMISPLRRERDSPAWSASTRSSRSPSSLAATTMVRVPTLFAMADPSSDKADQPEGGRRTPEDSAERLNQILSSPIENPFGRPPGADAGPPQSGGNVAPPEPAGSEAPTSLPSDLAAWEGAKAPAPEGGRDPEAPTPAGADTKVTKPEAAAAAAPAEVAAAPPGAARAPAPASAEPPRAARAPVDFAGWSAIAKVRQLMLISTLLTAIAIAAVLGIIGYRLFRSGESQPATLTLPPGAKI